MKEGNLPQVAGKAINCRSGAAIDVHPALLDLVRRIPGRRSPEHGLRFLTLTDRNAGERVPFLVGDRRLLLDIVLYDGRPDAFSDAVCSSEDDQAAKHDGAVTEELAGKSSTRDTLAPTGEAQPAGRAEDCNPEHRRGTANEVEQRQGAKTAESCAEQVRAVHDADRIGAPGQRQAHDDAREEEWKGKGEGEFDPGNERHDRCGQARDDGQLYQKRKDDPESEAERRDTEMVGQQLRPEGLGAEVDPDSSGSEPEHRDADDEKREMIPGRDGDDPGFDDLQHQGRCGNQS